MPPSTSSNLLGVVVHQNDQTWVITVAAWSANWFAECVELVIVVLPVQTHLLLESLKLIMHDSMILILGVYQLLVSTIMSQLYDLCNYLKKCLLLLQLSRFNSII